MMSEKSLATLGLILKANVITGYATAPPPSLVIPNIAEYISCYNKEQMRVYVKSFKSYKNILFKNMGCKNRSDIVKTENNWCEQRRSKHLKEIV